MAIQRCQIPIVFQYVSSGDVVPAPAGLAITVTVSGTGAPATIYANDAPDNTIVSSPVTDSNGAANGWVVEGTYVFSVPSSGGFTGATITWNAVRGDGVENIYAGAVGTVAIANGAVTAAKIASGTITTSQISGSAGIVGGQLANNTITNAKLAVSAERPDFTNQGGNYTANPGDLVIAVPSALITIPSASGNLDAIISVVANGSVTAAGPVVMNSVSNIKGNGFSANSFVLGSAYAHVSMQSDGTAWRIISGQQDTGWVSLTGALGTHVVNLETTPVSARLLGDMVYLRGTMEVSTGTLVANSVWVTLPSEFRPSGDTSLPIFAAGSTAPTIPCEFYLKASDGTIRNSTGSVAALNVVTLNGTSYTLAP